MKVNFIDQSNMDLEKRISLEKNIMESLNMDLEMGMALWNGKVIDTLYNFINNSD